MKHGGGPEEQVNATWREPFRKIVIAKWLYEKGLELGVSSNEMLYIPNGLNHSVFRVIKPINKRPQKIAMLYGEDFKGGRDGIKAIELAKKEFPSLQAVLFSSWLPRPSGLPRWIEYFQNPDQEPLTGKIYNGSSIYLCPSWVEGWGLPSVEAMACGCALISTDNGGVRDYAIHKETALFSPPKDPEKLAKSIIELLKDDNLRIKLAQNGYKHIQQFTWERSTDLLERFILENREK